MLPGLNMGLKKVTYKKKYCLLIVVFHNDMEILIHILRH